MADLVVAEVQLPQGTVGCQGPAESGEGVFPRAQAVPLQGEALDGLVLSEEFSQSLSSCSAKVIALEQEEASPSFLESWAGLRTPSLGSG